MDEHEVQYSCSISLIIYNYTDANKSLKLHKKEGITYSNFS